MKNSAKSSGSSQSSFEHQSQDTELLASSELKAAHVNLMIDSTESFIQDSRKIQLSQAKNVKQLSFDNNSFDNGRLSLSGAVKLKKKNLELKEKNRAW